MNPRRTTYALLLLALVSATSLIAGQTGAAGGEARTVGLLDAVRLNDEAIGRDVLIARVSGGSYDALSNSIESLRATLDEIASLEGVDGAVSRPALDALTAKFLKTAAHVEKFKSANSLLRNSLHYLPAEGSSSARAYSERLRALTRDCLLYYAGEDWLATRIAASIRELGARADIDESTRIAIRHAELLLTEKAIVDREVEIILGLETGPRHAELRDEATAHFAHVASRSWFLSLGGVIGLLVVVLLGISTYWSLATTGAELEKRVTLRTAELSASLETLNKAQAELLDSARLSTAGRLAASVAHEINNPLAYVLGNIRFARAEIERTVNASSEPWCEILPALQESEEGATRMSTIVRGMTASVRSSVVDKRDLNIHSVLRDALRVAENELRMKARIVTLFEGHGMIWADATTLNQLFLNLLVNAGHAIQGPAAENEISLSVRSTGESVIVSVSDSGTGISPEITGHIFEPFFTTKEVGKGTGLGLYICKGIVENHGGTISVRANGSRGTTFEVSLPVGDAGSGTAAMQTPAPSIDCDIKQIGKRVLSIDDDPLVARSLRRVLTGCEVVLEETVAGAIARLHQGEHFDLILCDLHMPTATGMAFHSEMVRSFPGIAESVYFLSGGAFTPELQEFAGARLDRMLTKPFDLDRIRSLVAAA